MEQKISADTRLLDDCYGHALCLLRRNVTAAGILAASPGARAGSRSYTSIFGRDAAICSLGMLASGEPDLREAAQAGLVTLARHRADNGQIPKLVRHPDEEPDFWYTGCIDATLWWLVAVTHLQRCVDQLPEVVGNSIAPAISWLNCQEHPTWGLLQQNEASDWADIMPRSGYVLYSNALWHLVKTLYRLPGSETTRTSAQFLFSPFGNKRHPQRRLRLLMHYVRNREKRSPLYLSFVNFATWGSEGDIFGNILAGLTSLTDASGSMTICRAIRASGATMPYPVRVVGTPLLPGTPLWRPYMERHRQNMPWHYHNGGIWPFVGGFFAILLARLGHRQEAFQCLEGVAAACRLNDWEFNEWLNGETGAPLGMPGQSWNAALYILAYQAICNGAHAFP